jgi:hypothetical protein
MLEAIKNQLVELDGIHFSANVGASLTRCYRAPSPEIARVCNFDAASFSCKDLRMNKCKQCKHIMQIEV